MMESLLEQGKRPTEPRSAIDIDWSSPKTLCQSLVVMVFFVRGDGMQNLTEVINAMRWEFDSFRGSIYEPLQDTF